MLISIDLTSAFADAASRLILTVAAPSNTHSSCCSRPWCSWPSGSACDGWVRRGCGERSAAPGIRPIRTLTSWRLFGMGSRCRESRSRASLQPSPTLTRCSSISPACISCGSSRRPLWLAFGFRAHRRLGVLAIARGDRRGPPILDSLPGAKMERRRGAAWGVTLTRNETAIAEHLRSVRHPETTVILHDRPLAPSLTTYLSP